MSIFQYIPFFMTNVMDDCSHESKIEVIDGFIFNFKRLLFPVLNKNNCDYGGDICS